jgi:hypothetical protein
MPRLAHGLVYTRSLFGLLYYSAGCLHLLAGHLGAARAVWLVVIVVKARRDINAHTHQARSTAHLLLGSIAHTAQDHRMAGSH